MLLQGLMESFFFACVRLCGFAVIPGPQAAGIPKGRVKPAFNGHE